MVAGRSSNRSVKILLEGDEIEQVEDFKLLGSMKTTNADCAKKIKKGSPLLKKRQQNCRTNGCRGIFQSN